MKYFVIALFVAAASAASVEVQPEFNFDIFHIGDKARCAADKLRGVSGQATDILNNIIAICEKNPVLQPIVEDVRRIRDSARTIREVVERFVKKEIDAAHFVKEIPTVILPKVLQMAATVPSLYFKATDLSKLADPRNLLSAVELATELRKQFEPLKNLVQDTANQVKSCL